MGQYRLAFEVLLIRTLRLVTEGLVIGERPGRTVIVHQVGKPERVTVIHRPRRKPNAARDGVTSATVVPNAIRGMGLIRIRETNIRLGLDFARVVDKRVAKGIPLGLKTIVAYRQAS